MKKGYLDQDQIWISVFAAAYVQHPLSRDPLAQVDLIAVKAEEIADAAVASFRRVHRFPVQGDQLPATTTTGQKNVELITPEEF